MKPYVEKGYAFLTLAEETQDSIIAHGLVYNHEKLKVSVT